MFFGMAPTAKGKFFFFTLLLLKLQRHQSIHPYRKRRTTSRPSGKQKHESGNRRSPATYPSWARVEGLENMQGRTCSRGGYPTRGGKPPCSPARPPPRPRAKLQSPGTVRSGTGRAIVRSVSSECALREGCPASSKRPQPPFKTKYRKQKPGDGRGDVCLRACVI